MKKVLFFALSAILLASCGGQKKEGSVKLSGAGATFPEPFYKIVTKDYAKVSGNDVTYGGVGSGAGIRSLKDKTVDFGATDVFLSEDELKEMGADIIHVPTALGAVVLSYNLPDVKDLKITSEIISDIYLGKIKTWDDAKIKALNPDAKLPSKGITPVFRSDGSGTTAVFSEYMTKVNPDWSTAIGSGKSLKFPVGVAAKGNTGVAGIISQTDGAFGYIGSEYALALNIPSALLQNSAGNFVKADVKSISASADIELPDDMRVVISNSANPEAYPISTFTWIIAYKEQNYNGRSEASAKALAALLNYIISDEGQTAATKTFYAPLSDKALAKTKAIINSITYNSAALPEPAK